MRKVSTAAKPPFKKPVISTGVEAGQWAERNGETSNFSARGRRRWKNAPWLRAAFARKAKREVCPPCLPLGLSRRLGSPLRSARLSACAPVEMTAWIYYWRATWDLRPGVATAGVAGARPGREM